MKNMYNFWGKANLTNKHLLVYHSLDVAVLGKTYLDNNPYFLSKYPELRKLLPFLLAIHDLGKFSTTFQLKRKELFTNPYDEKIISKYKDSSNHSIAGFKLFNSPLIEKNYIYEKLPILNLDDDLNEDIWKILASSVIGHHGAPPCIENRAKISVTHYQNSDPNYQIDDICAIEEFIKSIQFLLPSCKLHFELNSIKNISWLVAGFCTFCDWLGSNTNFFNYEEKIINLKKYFYSREKNAINILNYFNLNKKEINKNISFESFFNISTPTPLQSEIIDLDIPSKAKLFLIEDLPGAGKTEAALYLTYKIMKTNEMNGLFFALPTQTTSNSMYERFTNFFNSFYEKNQNPNLILTHQNANLNIEYSNYKKNIEQNAENDCSNWFFDSNRKSLLGDLSIGTIDQALISMLPIKFQSLRNFGLSGKIIIFDEFHCYSPYEMNLAFSLIEFHKKNNGISIIMSATLPDKIKSKIIGLINSEDQPLDLNPCYPLLSIFSDDEIIQKPLESKKDLYKNIEFHIRDSNEECLNLIIEHYRMGEAVCWIRNTISYATETYHQLIEKGIDKNDIILFHSRFALNDRINIENEVLAIFGKKSNENNRNKIIIATQVIEQALDLDFDFMITDMSPVENILQRSGRYHRHTRNNLGNIELIEGRTKYPIVIYGPLPLKKVKLNWYSDFFPKSSSVYLQHYAIFSFAKYIFEHKFITVPEDTRKLINYCHSVEHVWCNEFKNNIQKNDNNEIEKNSIAQFSKLDINDGYVWDGNIWKTDKKPTTRLIENSLTIILMKNNLNLYIKDNLKSSNLYSSLHIQSTQLIKALFKKLNDQDEIVEEFFNFNFQTMTLFLKLDSDNKCSLIIDNLKMLFEYSKLTGLSFEYE